MSKQDAEQPKVEPTCSQDESADRANDATDYRQSDIRWHPSEFVGCRIGNYHLTNRLGEGGFGTVWQAEQLAPIKRNVAIKLLKPGMDSAEIVARFAQERQALAVMDHPGIAKVLDAGVTSTGRPYFVMELVIGSPMNTYCDEHRLGVRTRLQLFVQTCLAVQHAHQKGVIHRDLKSSNILITETDAGPQPKVIDFGIAKAISQTLTDVSLHTQAGQFIGTPAYMSPEQADGQGLDLDTRADVYSLGVVLYQLLTGCLPFDSSSLKGRGPDELRRHIRELVPARPSNRLQTLSAAEQTEMAQTRGVEFPKLIHSVRGDLDWIIMKALEKDRTRRYDTALDLGADIRRHLNNEPVVARPPSPGYLLRRFASRHRAAVAAATGILATLVIGLAVSVTMFFREKAARFKAETSAAKSSQVATLLKEMLASAGPSVAQGKDASMLREILDNTADRVGTELARYPDVESELRTVLGNTYEDLGDFDRSREQYELALAIRRRTLPPNDGLIGESLYHLGSALDYLDKLEDSEVAIREAIAIQSIQQPRDDIIIAESRDLLAWLLHRLGDVEAAERESQAALEIFRQHQTDQRKNLARATTTLGTILLKAAKFTASETALRQAIQMIRDVHGPMHPKVVTAMNNLCHTLTKLGKYDEAEKIAVEALVLEEKITGKKLNSCTDSLHKVLAEVHESRGEYPAAIDDLNFAVQAASEMYGADHRFTSDKRSLLAQVQIRAGLLDDAQKSLDAARTAGGDVSADNSLDVASAKLALARGELENAEKSARVALDRARAACRAPTVEMIDAMQTMAAVLAAKNQKTDAGAMLRDAIQILKPELNADCPMMASLLADLAKIAPSNPAPDPH